MDLTWTVVKPSPLHPWGAAILKDGILHGEMGEELADYVISLQAQLAAREAELENAKTEIAQCRVSPVMPIYRVTGASVMECEGCRGLWNHLAARDAAFRTLALSSKDAYVMLEALRVSIQWELAPEIRAEIARVAHGLALALIYSTIPHPQEVTHDSATGIQNTV